MEKVHLRNKHQCQEKLYDILADYTFPEITPVFKTACQLIKKLRSYFIFQWITEVCMNTMNDLIYAFRKIKE